MEKVTIKLYRSFNYFDFFRKMKIINSSGTLTEIKVFENKEVVIDKNDSYCLLSASHYTTRLEVNHLRAEAKYTVKSRVPMLFFVLSMLCIIIVTILNFTDIAGYEMKMVLLIGFIVFMIVQSLLDIFYRDKYYKIEEIL